MTFSTGELTGFRNAHIGSFNSMCSINRMVVSTDSYGDVVKTPTVTANVPCGFEVVSGIKSMKGVTIVVDYDGVLRLPLTTPIVGLNDTITITEHLGNVTADVFEVYSVPTYGTVMTIKLKRKSN